MMVKNLITKLERFPPDMEVVCQSIDDYHGHKAFNVNEVREVDISTFGYTWSKHLVVGIKFNES